MRGNSTLPLGLHRALGVDLLTRVESVRVLITGGAGLSVIIWGLGFI